MRTSEQQLKTALQDFQPEFGNERHIYITRVMGRLSNLKAELERKQKEAKDLKTVLEKVERFERNILFLINK